MVLLELEDRVKNTEIITTPPEKEEQEDYDGGHNPEYSVVALVQKYINPVYGDDNRINRLREIILDGEIPERDRKVLGVKGLNQLAGLDYKDYDTHNVTIIWAKHYRELRDSNSQTYLFEDCAIYTVNSIDRMVSNTFSIVAITKIGEKFYTFLTQQDYENEESVDIMRNDPDEIKRWVYALSANLRGYFGHNENGDKCILSQCYTGKEPIIATVKAPFHNRETPPLSGKFEMFESRDDQKLEKLHKYDREMLRFSQGLTLNLFDTMSNKKPFGTHSGHGLRYWINSQIFPEVSANLFHNVDVNNLPAKLKGYNIFQFG